MSRVDIYDARNAAQIERLRMEEAIKRSIETAEREEAWRMKKAMMKFAHHLKMEGAVLTIQRMWRGWIARHSLYEQAHDARLAELVKNITTIQRMWRGRVCRRDIQSTMWKEWERENAIEIQRMWRGHAERKRILIILMLNYAAFGDEIEDEDDEIEDEDDSLFYSATGGVV